MKLWYFFSHSIISFFFLCSFCFDECQPKRLRLQMIFEFYITFLKTFVKMRFCAINTHRKKNMCVSNRMGNISAGWCEWVFEQFINDFCVVKCSCVLEYSNVHALNIGFACMGAIFNGFSVMPNDIEYTMQWRPFADIICLCVYAWLMYTCLVLVSMSTAKTIVKTTRMHKLKGTHENRLTLYRCASHEIWEII